MERRLAAILAADVVGYTRLMGADEPGTLRRLTELRQDVLNPIIAEHNGRLVKLMGDGLLVEFASVVDALNCAVAWQNGVAEREAAVDEDLRLQFRIGINLGDVIVEDEDIHGDGVNIAARLEGLAEPGGICVSRTVVNHVKGKLEVDLEDLGERQIKNVAEPVGVYLVVLEPTSASSMSGPAEELALPDKPSIAVLPFTNMSGDPEQEFFADGITEDIITTLSRILGLFVIARSSTFTYKNKAVNVRQVSRELGVRYVLEGSVRTAGNRVRVTAQLIDASSDLHLWADRFDRELTDVFAVQDEITTNVVKALQVELIEGEQARVWHHTTDNIQAWSCLTQAVVHFVNKLSSESTQAARKLLEEALALDPNYAAAWVWLGQMHWHDARFLWSDAPDESLAKALECAKKARSSSGTYSELHTLLGSIHLMRREFEEAVSECEKAVSLDPSGAYATGFLGFALNWVGRPAEGLSLAQKAMRYSPLHASWYFGVAAHAYRLLERHKDAIAVYQKAIRQTPDYISPHIGLTASYAETGRIEEARKQAAEILRIDPRFSVGRYAAALTYKLPEHAQRSLDALRAAGLPE